MKAPFLTARQRRLQRLGVTEVYANPFGRNKLPSSGFAPDEEGSVYQKRYHFARVDARDKADGSQI